MLQKELLARAKNQNNSTLTQSTFINPKLNNFQKLSNKIISVIDDILKYFLAIHPKFIDPKIYKQLYADDSRKDASFYNNYFDPNIKGTVLKDLTFDFDALFTDNKASKSNKSTTKSKTSKRSKPKSIGTLQNQISILNTLKENQGKFINLYDWLEAFSAGIGEKAITDESHLFFKKIYNEMKFIGLLKDSSRKTDTGEILNWSKF